MPGKTHRALGLAAAGAVTAGAAAAAMASSTAPVAAHRATVHHVLLISVDGMHQSDLDWFVVHHPSSALTKLVKGGADFTEALTPIPSDSFPGMVGMVTGGNPKSTGIYYDDTFNRALLPPGSDCATATPGTEVPYMEALDVDPGALDAGQGLIGLPGSILQMTGNPDSVIAPGNLPVDPVGCKPVYPHTYLQVNTVFEVARSAGLRTAWSDKHPAYEVLDGPSGTGVQDLFTPEINSDAPTAGSSIDWTRDNALTQQYDGYKVQAVLNEIDGFDHGGTVRTGVPAIFGMNFQSVSTAEKLPASDGLAGGYEPDAVTPGPLLSRALDFVDAKVGAMLESIKDRHLDADTAVILSAKHGQSPMDLSKLNRIDDGTIIDALNAAWATAHPTLAQPLVPFSVNDDGMLLWLNDRSATGTGFAKRFLAGYSGTSVDGKPYTSSGLVPNQIYAGPDAAAYFGVPVTDVRVPDVFGVAQYGVVYTGHQRKIAEHGGAHAEDRHVPLVVSGAGVDHRVDAASVETTQIAPTILTLLGLDPATLEAVQMEGTQALP